MELFTRKHATTLVILMMSALVAASIAPAIAHGPTHAKFSHNSDKVDGIHAVTSSAKKAKRRGKLVATSPTTGRLPNNIIKRAPNSDRLDGFDSTDFLLITDELDADTLDGLDSNDFAVENHDHDGIMLVQGDVSNWKHTLGSGNLVSSPSFSETTFTSTSASGSAEMFIVPAMPLAAYGKALELTRVEICYDAAPSFLVDQVALRRTSNPAGLPSADEQVLDGSNYVDEACRSYQIPAGGLATDSTVALTVDTAWTTTGAALKLGRVTFQLEPTMTNATPLS